MRFLPLILILLNFSVVLSQQTVATIKSKNGIGSIQGQTLGDSIFIAYSQSKTDQSQKNFRTAIISPNGDYHDLDLTELHKQVILAVVSRGDSMCFYFKDKKEVKVLFYSKKDKAKRIQTIPFESDRKIIASFLDKDLFFIGVDQAGKAIEFLKVRNADVIDRIEFKLRSGITELYSNTASVFVESHTVRAVKAKSPVKFYKQGDQFYVSIERREGYPSTTVILKLNLLNREVTRKEFPGEYAEDFSSFISGNNFFRVSKKRGFDVKIYGIESQKLVASLSIDKASPMAEEKSFIRNGMNNTIKQTETVKNVIKETGSCFLVAYPIDSSRWVLRMGTHHLSGPYVPIVSGLGVTAQLLTTAAQLAARALNDDSYDQYFYLEGSADQGFTYNGNVAVLDNQIDQFELKSESAFSYKGYLEGNQCVYGLYIYNKASFDLRIVKHQVPER